MSSRLFMFLLAAMLCAPAPAGTRAPLASALFDVAAIGCDEGTLAGRALSPELESFIRNVPNSELPLLLPSRLEMSMLPNVESVFKTGNWNNLQPNAQALEPVLRVAFLLALQQRISVDQLSTAILLWEAMRDLPYYLPTAASAIPILDAHGHLTADARAIFVREPISPLNSYYEQQAVGATQIAEFERRVATLAVSERFFWRFRFPLQIIDGRWQLASDRTDYQPPIVRMVEQMFVKTRTLEGWYNLHMVARLPRQDVEIFVPSMSVLRISQRMRFTEGLKPVPQLGIVDGEEILGQIRNDERVFGLKFPRITGLQEADGFACGSLMYSFHDLFHLIAGSWTRRGFRKALAGFGLRLPALRREVHNLNIGGREVRLDASSSVEGLFERMTGRMVDVAFRDRTEDFAQLLRQVFAACFVTQDNTLFCSDGLGYLLIDMATHESEYTELLGEPIPAILSRLDGNRTRQGLVSALSIFQAAKANVSIPIVAPVRIDVEEPIP